ncbi:MAG: hypothetical protein MR419_07520 [Clostridiales bacterium]|nr:hypothetical protein [Clostridiales bacterium]MDY4172962.1 hypothetical protein [Evtepia sp.]
MALKMDENTFLNFYADTMQGYSKAFRRYTLRIMEEKEFASFDAQLKLPTEKSIPFLEKDSAISITTTDIKFSSFYEYLEFIKLYKYSVPFFYEIPNNKELKAILDEKGYKLFDLKEFHPDFMLGTVIGEESPIYFPDGDETYIKFVLQKSYINPDSETVNYRFPIIIYINIEKCFLEIRYDSTRYDPGFSIDSYSRLVFDCIDWLKNQLGLKLFICDHKDMISIVKENSDGSVKIYKQMMQLSSGGSAELTASEQEDYVLPFIGELRELIDENEEIFNRCKDSRNLLLQYLDDKEATASYPYIYIKWVKPVESESYTVKVIFDYFNTKYTLMQHISGQCKDLGKERMNNAIKYLCESASFTKGDEI